MQSNLSYLGCVDQGRVQQGEGQVSLDGARVRRGGRHLYVHAIVGVTMWTQALERLTVLYMTIVESVFLGDQDVKPVGDES